MILDFTLIISSEDLYAAIVAYLAPQVPEGYVINQKTISIREGQRGELGGASMKLIPKTL